MNDQKLYKLSQLSPSRKIPDPRAIGSWKQFAIRNSKENCILDGNL